MLGIEGKLPPQSRDLEEAVLGAMMLEKDAVPIVIEILNPESFYDNRHSYIYEAILDLFSKGEPIDILTAKERLKEMGKLEESGGAFYISELTNRVASAANVEHHARIVSQKFIQRELVRIGQEMIRDCYDDTIDVFEVITKLRLDIGKATTFGSSNAEKASDILIKTLKTIEEVKTTGQPKGVKTNLKEIDRLFGSFQNGDLIIVAARPGMGKTAFMLSIARNTSVYLNTPTAIFSFEMSKEQLGHRLIAMETGVEVTDQIRGKVNNWEKLNEGVDKLANAELYIDDKITYNIDQLRAACINLVSKYGIKLIIVDYIQLIATPPTGRSREQDVSEISRGLKVIAKELDVPVIALSQLSRKVEERGGDKKPQLSDLRESGSLEQDSTVVIFLWRGEYYGIEPEDGSSNIGDAEAIVAKHRNGALKDISLRFKHKEMEFVDFVAETDRLF